MALFFILFLSFAQVAMGQNQKEADFFECFRRLGSMNTQTTLFVNDTLVFSGQHNKQLGFFVLFSDFFYFVPVSKPRTKLFDDEEASAVDIFFDGSSKTNRPSHTLIFKNKTPLDYEEILYREIKTFGGQTKKGEDPKNLRRVDALLLAKGGKRPPEIDSVLFETLKVNFKEFQIKLVQNIREKEKDIETWQKQIAGLKNSYDTNDKRSSKQFFEFIEERNLEITKLCEGAHKTLSYCKQIDSDRLAESVAKTTSDFPKICNKTERFLEEKDEHK